MGATFIPSVDKSANRKRAAFPWPAGLRGFVLALLFTASGVYEAAHLSGLFNPNVWLHLRSGTWMLQTHSIPQSGLFSQYTNLPWVDSSWTYDAVLALCYRLFGLRAIPLLLMMVKVALAVVTYVLAKEGKASFWTAACLSAVAQYVVPVSQSLPYVLSILFFAVELVLLQKSRRTGKIKELYWLPLLLLLWANVHALFVSGLVLLGLFVVSIGLEEVLKKSSTRLDRQISTLPVRPVALIAAGSFLATLVNPYTYRIFPAAYRLLYSDVGFQYFAEMRSMSFRRPQDYLLMLLVMAAFLALGRRRSVNIFEVLTLIAGTLVAFRIQREGWLAVLPAIAVLSHGFGFTEKGREVSCEWDKRVAWLVAAAILGVAVLRIPRDAMLMFRAGQTFPVKACDFIRAHHLPQPIFNEYSWGSFMAWYLPEYPVAIDSRVELYGNDITENYFKVIAGGVRLDTNPSLAAAQTLLLQKQSGMVKALTTIPALTSQYRLAYSDDTAAVFVRR